MTPPKQILIVALKLPDGSYKLLSIAEKREGKNGKAQ